MHIRGLEIKNKVICVKDIEMSFAQNGIYFITGENGCGKTTLLERVIFGTDGVFFDDEEEARCYREERYNLLTYCPQKVVVNELRVWDYIHKLNRAVTKEATIALLQRFDMRDEVLEQRFYTLSGGEQMKVSIVAGLLKKTPYIFLDEPTNYLDNASVSKLVSVLKEEAEKRRVIIVSHDARLSFSRRVTYRFANGGVHKVEEIDKVALEHSVVTERNLGQNRTPSIWQTIWRYARNGAYVSTMLIVFFLFVGITLITDIGFYDSVDTSGHPKKGTIYAYNMGSHDALNEYYEAAEGLKVNSEKYNVEILLTDIPSIAQKEGVEEAYILDQVHFGKLSIYLGYNPYESFECDGVFVLSCPEDMWDYLESSLYGVYMRYIQGDLPKDGTKEVVISKNLLITEYGYTEEDAERAIGNTIRVESATFGVDDVYTIVGLCQDDFAWISYEPGINYGIYQYAEDTYDEFCAKERTNLAEWGYDDCEKIASLLLKVDNKEERRILNEMFMEYPAACYISNYYSITFVRQQIIEFAMRWIVIHLVFSGIVALIVWLVNRNGIRHSMRLIWDIGNYYTNRKRMMLYYLAFLLVGYLFVVTAIILLNHYFYPYAEYVNMLICMDGILIFVSLLISCILAYREANA